MGFCKVVLFGVAIVSVGFIVVMIVQVQNEQFILGLVYCIGAYVFNGILFVDGVVDYILMLNVCDGGINGVKIFFEECEIGYVTDCGVECYECFKGKGLIGVVYFSLLSIGIIFVFIEKALGDKILLIIMGYGCFELCDGSVFEWNFLLLGIYWMVVSVVVQYIVKEMGGVDKFKGKKIVLFYYDLSYGKELIVVFEVMLKKFGFEFLLILVLVLGSEQKLQWLQICQQKFDYVLLWGWGVMNFVVVIEVGNVNYLCDKMIGVWWLGVEFDVIFVGDKVVGYKVLMLQYFVGKFVVYVDFEKFVISMGKLFAKLDEIGLVFYNCGLINLMLGIEVICIVMVKFGNKLMIGEQVCWGIEYFDFIVDCIKQLGFEGMIQLIKVLCVDYEGACVSCVYQWDGKQWKVIFDWYIVDDLILVLMVKDMVVKYVIEKKIIVCDCFKESQNLMNEFFVWLGEGFIFFCRDML